MTCHVARWVGDVEWRPRHVRRAGAAPASSCVLAELEAAEARSCVRMRRVCEVCAQPIAPERLQAAPTTRLCTACQEIPKLAVGW